MIELFKMEYSIDYVLSHPSMKDIYEKEPLVKELIIEIYSSIYPFRMLRQVHNPKTYYDHRKRTIHIGNNIILIDVHSSSIGTDVYVNGHKLADKLIKDNINEIAIAVAGLVNRSSIYQHCVKTIKMRKFHSRINIINDAERDFDDFRKYFSKTSTEVLDKFIVDMQKLLPNDIFTVRYDNGSGIELYDYITICLDSAKIKYRVGNKKSTRSLDDIEKNYDLYLLELSIILSWSKIYNMGCQNHMLNDIMKTMLVESELHPDSEYVSSLKKDFTQLAFK